MSFIVNSIGQNIVPSLHVQRSPLLRSCHCPQISCSHLVTYSCKPVATKSALNQSWSISLDFRFVKYLKHDSYLEPHRKVVKRQLWENHKKASDALKPCYFPTLFSNKCVFYIYIPYFFVVIQQRLGRGKNKHVEVQPQTNWKHTRIFLLSLIKKTSCTTA